MRDITLGETIIHAFSTRAFTTGVPTTLAGSPVLSVLEGGNATPITAGVSLSVDRASVAGLHEATIVATGGNGYEAGKSYAIYISTGTVGGVSVVGEVVGQFSIQGSAAFTRLGAPAGASVSVDVAAIKAETATILSDTNDLQTRVPAALTADGNMKTDTLYALGRVWIDTGAGAAGTTNYVHGTLVNPNSSMANSRTIADSVNLTAFQVRNGSSITLDQGYINFSFFGERWTLALASRAIPGSHFQGAVVSGLSTGTGTEWDDCLIGTATIANDATFIQCGLSGVLTLQAAGNYIFDGCYTATTAGVDAAIDFGALGATTVAMRDYAGGLEVRNMAAGDVLTFIGGGRLTIAASCTAGTILCAGPVNLVNNGSGQTITDTARWNEDQNIANVTSNVVGTIGGLTAAALADFFDTNSGTTYGAAVAGSVVKEIADNPSVGAMADAVWDEDATGHQTQGTFGQAIGDPAADANTIYKAVVSDAGAATIGLDVVAIDDFLDTEVAAILAAVDTEVGAIKTQTDKFVFTVTNEVNANIQSVNDVTVIGDGSATPWGPA